MHSSIDAQVEKKNKEKQSLSISKVCYCVYNSKICALPTAKERGGEKDGVRNFAQRNVNGWTNQSLALEDKKFTKIHATVRV